MRLTKCCIALALAVLPAPAGARAAWNQPVGGEQPLNRAAADPASHASLAAVGATPWVAWVEDHDNGEVRAARLKADGSGWDRAPDTANPINRSEAGDAELPSITAHGGVPCVAWDEFDGVNTEVRVACRNGDDWERVADSASPINFDAGQDGSDPSLASFNGTLYVAWSELNSSNVSQIHVARQNGNAWEKVPASSLNRNVTHNAHNPSLAVVGTQLHVAWNENDGTSNKIRVSRFNGSGWDPVADTTGGLNQNPAMNAADPSLADIGGIPHVAWSEIDGDGHRQIRVAKLEGGTAWVKVGQDDNPTSPINKSFNHDAEHPSLAGIGSPARPYVAWTEVDANGVSQVRVAQLKASGTGWERVADSASPINHASQESAANASLAAVGGVPWVAWTERDPDSTTQNRIDQARVTRLEPSFAGASATDVAQTGATLTVEATTYGLPYPIGFAYGPSLGQSTTPQPAPTGQGDTVTFSQPVTGLTAATEYQFRPFATAGTASPPVLGQTASFTTASPPPTCTPVSKTTAHETAVNLTLQCAGQGTLAYEVVSGPAHGQLSGLDSAAGTVTYTPNAAFSGQDSFTYRATNTGGASNTATVTIEVTPPPP
ncbi:MAG: Ig-like domain-containing protein, partial [Solirubrobacterales bacterium]